MQMFGVKPCNVIKMNQDGTISIQDDTVEAQKGEVTDPSELEKTEIAKPGMGENVPKNNWRDATQGIVQPVDSLPDFAAVLNPKTHHDQIQKQAAENEKAAHEAAKKSPMAMMKANYYWYSMV